MQGYVYEVSVDYKRRFIVPKELRRLCRLEKKDELELLLDNQNDYSIIAHKLDFDSIGKSDNVGYPASLDEQCRMIIPVNWAQYVVYDIAEKGQQTKRAIRLICSNGRLVILGLENS